jgi:hypothetical protein
VTVTGATVRSRRGWMLVAPVCLLLGLAAAPAPPSGPAGAAATVAHASASAAARDTLRLAPGLSASEHAALTQSGAYGRRPLTLLLVGDSIALTLGIGLAVDSRQSYGVDVSDHATLGCDLDPGTEIETSGQPGPATAGCGLWRALWPFLAAGAHAQVVALGLGRWEVSDHLLNGRWVHIGQPVWDDHVKADLREAISIFHTFGARVVLFTMPYVDPPGRQLDGLPYPEDTPARARAYNALVWQVARAEPHVVSVIDLNKMLSPAGRYTAALDGTVVRWSDGIHITTAGGELLQRQILPAVAHMGLQDEAARTHR